MATFLKKTRSRAHNIKRDNRPEEVKAEVAKRLAEFGERGRGDWAVGSILGRQDPRLLPVGERGDCWSHAGLRKPPLLGERGAGATPCGSQASPKKKAVKPAPEAAQATPGDAPKAVACAEYGGFIPKGTDVEPLLLGQAAKSAIAMARERALARKRAREERAAQEGAGSVLPGAAAGGIADAAAGAWPILSPVGGSHSVGTTPVLPAAEADQVADAAANGDNGDAAKLSWASAVELKKLLGVAKPGEKRRLAAAVRALHRRTPSKARQRRGEPAAKRPCLAKASDGGEGVKTNGTAPAAQEDEDEEGEEEEDEDGESEVSVKLELDEDGRVGHHGPPLDYSFRTFSDAFDVAQLKQLRRDCKAAFTARAAKQGEKYSAGKTFWIGAKEKGATTLERLALDIFKLHAGHTKYDPARSGAEWWTQAINVEDDIGWHWDRDYGLEGDTGYKLHPHLGTVTYLSNVGAPTMVLQDAIEGSGDRVSGLHVSFPKVGKHMAFDGRWLHGAPSDLAALMPPPEKSVRYTFLVNVWLNHKPLNVVPFRNSEGALSEALASSAPLSSRFLPEEPQVLESGLKLKSYEWRLRGVSSSGSEEGSKKKKSARLTVHLPAKKLKEFVRLQPGCSASFDPPDEMAPTVQ